MAEPFFKEGHSVLYIIFFLVLTAQIAMSFALHPVKTFFETVPPVPTPRAASIHFLGDRELAYRSFGTMIQNFGDTGGNHTALKNYNFERLSRWFFLEHELNPKSDYIPFLAAYYFGGSQDTSKLSPVIDYLEIAGNSAEGEKWRWLGQAVYLARFRMNDYDRALGLAYKLSDLYGPGLPGWVKQMPAFVQLQMGEKEAAHAFMLEILKESAENMHPNEVSFMVDYICTRLLDAQKSKTDPLCQDMY